MFDSQNIPNDDTLAGKPREKLVSRQSRGGEPHQNELKFPRVSRELRALAFAWEVQANKFGRISRQILQRIDQIASGRTQTRDKQPGMRLVREWSGKTHVVVIDDDGVIHWNDQTWRSLSEVARAIRLLFPVYGSVVTAASMARRFFTHILSVAKLQKDGFGRPRSLYSLRHFALQLRLKKSKGKVNIYWLAKNAGTSVDQLERFYLKGMALSEEQIQNLHSFGE